MIERIGMGIGGKERTRGKRQINKEYHQCSTVLSVSSRLHTHSAFVFFFFSREKISLGSDELQSKGFRGKMFSSKKEEEVR